MFNYRPKWIGYTVHPPSRHKISNSCYSDRTAAVQSSGQALIHHGCELATAIFKQRASARFCTHATYTPKLWFQRSFPEDQDIQGSLAASHEAAWVFMIWERCMASCSSRLHLKLPRKTERCEEQNTSSKSSVDRFGFCRSDIKQATSLLWHKKAEPGCWQLGFERRGRQFLKGVTVDIIAGRPNLASE